MLTKFWKERVEDYNLRKDFGLDNSLEIEAVEPLLLEVAELTEGLSGRSLMQFANGSLVKCLGQLHTARTAGSTRRAVVG